MFSKKSKGLNCLNDDKFHWPHINDLAQDCGNSIADALELPQHSTNCLNHPYIDGMYCKVSNIRHTLAGNKFVDHSDVVGASPVGAAPTTSSFST